MRADPDDMIVTTGGQQVIDLVTKTLVDPGDVVVCEAPTYPGAVPTFQSYEADVVQIEMDSDGMRIDLLEETLDRLEVEGQPPEVRLHGADLPEPRRRDALGATASASRRDRAGARAARARGQPLRAPALRGRAGPPLRALDGGVYVLYLGTFSKILSPGIRLGWVVAPAPCSRRSTSASRRPTSAPRR